MDGRDVRNFLIIEADQAVTALIGAALDVAGYRHTACSCSSTALFSLQTDRFDLILLDIGPGCPSALDLLENLCRVETPLIVLADQDNIAGQVRGLQLGAENYLIKPFEPAALVGRIKTVLGRQKQPERALQYQDIEVDLPSRLVRQQSRRVDLTPREFDLLVLLIRHTDLALSRERILQAVWGYCFAGETRTVDMHIMQLRKKLGLRQKLKTITKIGYRLDR
jgi:DNA-binding response OmpR family regulator